MHLRPAHRTTAISRSRGSVDGTALPTPKPIARLGRHAWALHPTVATSGGTHVALRMAASRRTFQSALTTRKNGLTTRSFSQRAGRNQRRQQRSSRLLQPLHRTLPQTATLTPPERSPSRAPMVPSSAMVVAFLSPTQGRQRGQLARHAGSIGANRSRRMRHSAPRIRPPSGRPNQLGATHTSSRTHCAPSRAA